jgi:hypothetical protein
MFRLERPSMAVNDRRVQRRFQLGSTWDIESTETRGSIINRVAAIARSAPGRRLKHLVLSCHGSPGYLQLGEGFGFEHLGLFASWRGLIGKIWLPNCRVARAPNAEERASGMRDGHAFCSGLATQVRCYVVASTETQVEVVGPVAPDMMTSFEGLLLSYGPAGKVTWEHRYPSTYTTVFGVPFCNP